MLITDCSKPENSVWNILVQIVLLMAWANTLGRDCLGQDSANCGPKTKLFSVRGTFKQKVVSIFIKSNKSLLFKSHNQALVLILLVHIAFLLLILSFI